MLIFHATLRSARFSQERLNGEGFEANGVWPARIYIDPSDECLHKWEKRQKVGVFVARLLHDTGYTQEKAL